MRALSPFAITPQELPDALRQLAEAWLRASAMPTAALADNPAYSGCCTDVQMTFDKAACELEQRLEARLGEGQ